MRRPARFALAALAAHALGGCLPSEDDAGDAGAGTPNVPDGPGAVGAYPGAPAGATDDAVAALAAVNAARVAAGSPCATMVAALNAGAAAHCAYYAANRGAGECIANPHVEVDGCASFFAANFDERERLAGYMGGTDSEDMHFVGDGAGAVQGWLDTIYHRYPLLNPWALDLGYGGAEGCDTMELGVGAGGSTPADAVAVYPFDGQTGVPTAFAGGESPAPPAPPAGWPAGYPLSIFTRGTVSAATVARADGGDPLPVTLVPKLSWQGNAVFFYTDAPLDAATAYRVTVSGTGPDGTTPFTLTWHFTTQ